MANFRAWAQLISGKLIQSSIFRVLGHDTGRFLENSSKIDHLVENNIILFQRSPGRDTDRFLENSSALAHALIFYKNWWMNFPEIGLAHAPEIEISKKYWMSFPEIRLYHTPENWNFGKFSGWVFQDLSIKVNKLLILMTILDQERFWIKKYFW